MKNLNDLKQKGSTFLRKAALLLALAGSITAFSQDAAVAPTNGYADNSLFPAEVFKIPWITGGGNGIGGSAVHFGTVTPTVTGTGNGTWTNLGNIINSGLTDFATNTVAVPTTLGTLYTTSPVSVSDGNTYNTTPFTGYRVGVKVSRSTTGATAASLGNIIIKTYLGANPVETSPAFGWALTGTTDVGFFVQQPFDRVEIILSSTGSGFGGGTLLQNIQQIYLQRYTRTGGGYDTVGDKVSTCNAQIPLTGRGVTAGGYAAVAIPVPPFIVLIPAASWPTLVPNLEDEDPVSHGTIPFISLGLATYRGTLKDEGVIYPAGTFGGGVYQLNAVSGGVNVTKRLRFYLDGVQQGSDVVNEEFLSASASGGLLTVGAVSDLPFDAIEFEIQMNVTAAVGALEIYYPIVQRFCDAVITCGAPVSLIAGEISPNGVQNHPVYTRALGTSILTASLGNPGITNVQNVIDTNLNSYAEIGAATGASLFSNYGISVISRQKLNPGDPDNTTNRGYPDGTFAGFEIQDDSFATASAGKNFIISTYKNGIEVDRYSTTNVLAANLFTPNNGKYIIGFKSPAFDEVRITVELIAGASAGSSTKVYRAVIETFCVVPAQACNTVTNLKRPVYPVFIDAANTGVEGVATGNTYFEDLDNLVANTNQPAKLYTAIGGITNASVAVQDGSKAIGVPGDATYELYPAGTFAGFDVAFPTLVAAELAGSTITISTLNADGTVADSAVMNSSFFGLHTSILNGTANRQILGFASDAPFTGVKLTVNKAASTSAGVLEIYSAVIERFCATPVIKCDEIENISVPKYPLYVNGERTGVTAFIDGNSSISLSQNAIDNDPNSYAAMQLGASVGSGLGFSVANGFGDFPKDTYIGFDISTLDIAQASAFESNKIELYKDGGLVQTSTGTQLAGGLSTAAVVGGFQRLVIGTVAHVPFDEVRYVITRAAGASAGEIRIHNVVARDFSPTSSTTCPLVLQCDGTYVLTDGPNVITSPRIPAVIEYANTGYEGLASAGYGIDNVWNAVSSDPSDFATIHLPASGAAIGSISVAIPKVTLPAGTFAGFTVDKANFPFSGGFLTNVKITTYLDGQEQEFKNGSALADFSFFGQWFGTPANIYTPGFQTTKPFDEVKISIGSLASLGDQTLRVYSAYIRTVPSTTTTLPGGGTTTPITCINGACYKPGATGGTVLETKHGITALSRAGSSDSDNWPMVRNGAWTVLESKEKGFVINRVALTANLSSITNPIEGMMVYDEEADCLKIYTIKDGDTTAAWHCFNTQACPD
ncbi:hypothetical protein [Chryseobacterium echinoideorum]|uniref:hypothetical protein n=1 Tax=Chryseobacterium echinoideorum TaxID=1549648 RepID=UPI0011855637|nr:hypothetical protein [Chryseobacterium echinoideorum]